MYKYLLVFSEQTVRSGYVPGELEQLWEDEWRQAVLRAALSEVRREVQETTYRAFELFALQDQPAKAVAKELGLSENAVSSAKRRVLARLREILPLIQDTF